MGGCKCAFFNCNNSTTLAKESNSVHSHFFHFPIRDLKRCAKWAIYSNNIAFLQLPMQKLKNKVICDMHFAENEFMNYTRSKLNKTTAVPTIYVDPETKEEIDLLETPTDWVKQNRESDIPEQFLNQSISSIDIDTSDSGLRNQSSFEPPEKKPKLDQPLPAQPIKILNKIPVSHSVPQTKQVITVKQVKNPVAVQKVINKNLPITIEKIVTKAPEKPQILKQEFIHTPQFTVIENCGQEQEGIEVIATLNENDISTAVAPTVSDHVKMSDELKDEISANTKALAELKDMLREHLNKPQKLAPESSNISQSQMNKAQLFNGIKRYLSPSLTALLRMEMFGNSQRDYKKDEKIVCTEILKLGNEAFDFFTDEWRLRLPSKEVVSGWLNEDITEDEAL